MRAILLSAGYGTRLRPLTNIVPKCLIPIKGKPLLEIWFDRLSQANVKSFLVNTHYLANQVNKFVETSPYSSQVSLVHEPELLGTAGTLRANLDFFQGRDGLLIHADNYCLADFKEFIAAHQKRPPEALLTLMTFRTSNPSSCGIVELDDRGVVTNFHEKIANPPGNLASGAVYLLSSKFIEIFQKDFKTQNDFSTEVIPHLMSKIYTYETSKPFIDIGTPKTYLQANLPQSFFDEGSEKLV